AQMLRCKMGQKA
ncbi:periplasmic solute binding family protein, partial [Vibrio parahaemolyticus EKP-021]